MAFLFFFLIAPALMLLIKFIEAQKRQTNALPQAFSLQKQVDTTLQLPADTPLATFEVKVQQWLEQLPPELLQALRERRQWLQLSYLGAAFLLSEAVRVDIVKKMTQLEERIRPLLGTTNGYYTVGIVKSMQHDATLSESLLRLRLLSVT